MKGKLQPSIPSYGQHVFHIFIFLFLFTSTAFSASITVYWNRNPEPDIAGYRVYWRLPSETEFHVSNDIYDNQHEPLERSFKIEGLETGKDYYIGITAFDMAMQESGMSTIITKTAVDEETEQDQTDQPEIPSDTVHPAPPQPTNYTGSFSLLYIDQIEGLSENATEIEAVTGDVNGDGSDDLLLIGTDGIYAALSDGVNLTSPLLWYSYDEHDGETESIGLTAHQNGWRTKECTDMNNDGFDDLILSNEAEDKLAVCFLTSDGIDHELIISNIDISSSRFYGPEDFDDDGYNEFLILNTETGNLTLLYLYENDAFFIKYCSLSIFGSRSIIGVGHFDSSNSAGMLMSLTSSMTLIASLHQDEGDTFNTSSFYNNEDADIMVNSTILSTSGDFNGDGINDLFTMDKTTGEYYIWLVEDGVIGEHLPIGIFFDADTQYFSNPDINSDGISDILFRSSENGSYLILMSE